MTRLIAPILSFTAEEIWKYLPNKEKSGTASQASQGKAESIFLSGFPDVDERYIDSALEAKWERLIKIRDEANKALEIKRKDKFLGNALEAELIFYPPEEDFTLLNEYREFLPALFIVSKVEIQPTIAIIADSYESPEVKGLFIKVGKAPGEKCERCWNRSPLVGSFSDHPGICERCHGALK
jgi:isoleucyl-tRNA synthetase